MPLPGESVERVVKSRKHPETYDRTLKNYVCGVQTYIRSSNIGL